MEIKIIFALCLFLTSVLYLGVFNQICALATDNRTYVKQSHSWAPAAYGILCYLVLTLLV